MSIREISRRTGLARNTVKKHLRSEESEPKYPRRVSSSKLDPYAEKLATWLVIEATKSRKQRRTLRQIHTMGPPMDPRSVRNLDPRNAEIHSHATPDTRVADGSQPRVSVSKPALQEI
jgi:predicted transcriptional regulator